MNLGTNIKISLANILTSKLRSALTLLGVLVGTASVVALVSSGQLATEHALAQFKTLGTDLLAVSIQTRAGTQTKIQQREKLTVAQAEQLVGASPSISRVAPYTINFANISYAGHKVQAGVVGATKALADITKITTKQGRFITSLDGGENYAVLGEKVAKQLHDFGLFNPIGKQIQVGKHEFTIIGVANAWQESLFMYANINQGIIIPIQTSLRLNKYVNISNILFQLKHGSDIAKIENSLRREVQFMLPNKQLFFRSAEELLTSMRKQRQTFTLMLGAIGGISLLVGGIGVMNIMLVSVIERRREIGIRMAIGAKRRNIQTMFLTEAVVLTCFGGILGIIVGIIVSLLIAEFSHWGFHLFLLPPAVGFLVSVFVGVFFGFYPAYKAARLDPIETLRAE